MEPKKNQYFPSIVFHPGEILAEKLEELKIGSKEFAVRTGKPEKTITAILKGRSSITAVMAVKFEYVLHIPAHFWLNLQKAYDEYQARIELQKHIETEIIWAKLFPYNDMVKKGWVKAKTNWKEKSDELRSFFCVSDSQAWEKFYLGQALKVAFRISLAHTSKPHAISAWLRRGELQAAELPNKEYSDKAFKSSLPRIKSLMASHPTNFFKQLRDICMESGVKVIFTPTLPKAPINGSTRWIRENPVIQLSGRYKRNDIFWFTFFHEAGHILLHHKKDIFLEYNGFTGNNNQKEKEADDFAVKWTLTNEEEAEILKHYYLTEEDIKKFAVKFNTHPAIIIGRLQHKKLIPFSVGRKFIEPVELHD